MSELFSRIQEASAAVYPQVAVTALERERAAVGGVGMRGVAEV